MGKSQDGILERWLSKEFIWLRGNMTRFHGTKESSMSIMVTDSNFNLERLGENHCIWSTRFSCIRNDMDRGRVNGMSWVNCSFWQPTGTTYVLKDSKGETVDWRWLCFTRWLIHFKPVSNQFSMIKATTSKSNIPATNWSHLQHDL